MIESTWTIRYDHGYHHHHHHHHRHQHSRDRWWHTCVIWHDIAYNIILYTIITSQYNTITTCCQEEYLLASSLLMKLRQQHQQASPLLHHLHLWKDLKNRYQNEEYPEERSAHPDPGGAVASQAKGQTRFHHPIFEWWWLMMIVMMMVMMNDDQDE